MADVQMSRQILQDSPKVLELRLTGHLLAANGRQVDLFFEDSLEKEKPKHVLLNLTDLALAATPLYGSLLYWKETLNKQSGQLVLVGLRPEIASTLRLFGLDRILTIQPDQAAALAALGK